MRNNIQTPSMLKILWNFVNVFFLFLYFFATFNFIQSEDRSVSHYFNSRPLDNESHISIYALAICPIIKYVCLIIQHNINANFVKLKAIKLINLSTAKANKYTHDQNRTLSRSLSARCWASENKTSILLQIKRLTSRYLMSTIRQRRCGMWDGG